MGKPKFPGLLSGQDVLCGVPGDVEEAGLGYVSTFPKALRTHIVYT